MPDKLDHNSATPLYLQLEAILRDNIAEGIWQPGQRIPSESELALSYGLSRMTARAVLTQLVPRWSFIPGTGKRHLRIQCKNNRSLTSLHRYP